MNRNVLVGHRGCPLEFPENSLPGLRRCVELDARYVEIDVQVTKDQKVVLHHDRTLDRCCGHPGAVHELTLAELDRLSFSEPDYFGDRFHGLPPARLQEAVRLCRTAAGMTLFIEVKPVSVERFGTEVVLDAIRRAVPDPGRSEVLISYRTDLLESAQRRGWDDTGRILHDGSQAGDPDSAGHRFLFCNVSRLPVEGSLALEGHRLGVYDVVDPELGGELLNRGVDLVETFDLAGMIGDPDD